MTNYSIMIGIQLKDPATHHEPIRVLDRSDPLMAHIVVEGFRALSQLDLAAKQLTTGVIR